MRRSQPSVAKPDCGSDVIGLPNSMLRKLSLIPAMLLPLPALAHPHVFVQVDMAVVFAPDGEVAVRLDWVYDAYFSMLVTSDLGIDADGDLQLTPEEQVMLDEQIAAWPPDFEGDLEVLQGEQILTLADKRDHAMIYQDGLMRETHLRPITLADRTTPLTILPYDPTYYIAYEIAGDVTIEGRDDCEVSIIPADLNAAYSLVDELLYGRPASDVGPDEEFPEVGRSFADTVVVTCAGLL
ncbi:MULTISPECIES: DUF1007 family protein [unclassified Yoonia]|uniref:DUF1007 family protein n=1 Tax=unclassified Yoonia TaxID=2629118 RepID=UPI002AFE2DC3|nr:MULTISPECIES: DUF1007 family protein [unclassified Yoonia]